MRPFISTLAAATLLTCAAAAAAQPFETPPPAAAPRPLRIAAPSEQKLDNGMRLITARREGVPLVSALLVVLSGSETDPPKLSGLASLAAGLLTEGTRQHTAPQLAAAAEALGGSLESGAAWGQSTVSITVTTPKLDAALGLMAEVARLPTFAPEEIERLRTQMLDGLKVAYADPSRIAGLAAGRLAYGGSAWGHPAGGTPSSLPRITRADLAALHTAVFRPDRAILILTGDINPGSALTLARAHFGTWKAPGRAAPAEPPVPATAAAGPALAIIDMPGAGQAGVTLAVPLPPQQGTDWAVGAVMNAVLGGGYSSRLNQEIRIKRGLSYGAGSRIEPRQGSALFAASVQTKNESTAEVVSLLQAEIDRIMQGPVDDVELAARKAALIGDFSRSVETTAGLAGAIDALLVSGRDPAALNMQIDAIEAVRAADVQQYAAAHLGAADRRIAVAGVAERFAAELKTSVPTLQLIGANELDLDRAGGLKRAADAK
jgi:zinc protease